MIHATILIDSFNRGELSPKLYYRSDAEFYLDGLKALNNFVSVPRGAVRKRTGFRYLSRVAIPDPTVNVFPQTTTLTITTPSVDVQVV